MEPIIKNTESMDINNMKQQPALEIKR